MKKSILISFFTVICMFSFGTTYYVNSITGSDDAFGTSSDTPWKSISKVNSIVFNPGDKILFACGSSWSSQLNPQGSGTNDNPIVIDKYGTGPLPLIDGGGYTGNGTFYLFKQTYWIVNNLELTAKASIEGDRRGVLITGPCNNIHLNGLKIHDVTGLCPPGINGIEASLSAKRTGGIGFDEGGENILVENCLIYNVDLTGIYSEADIIYPGIYKNFVIRNNTLHDIAKNAMIIRGCDETGLVEYNVCFNTCTRFPTGNTIFSAACNGTVFQFNEGYWNRASEGDKDGSLYDADINGANNTKWQYSYSHDNSEGLMWFCTEPSDTNVICRYNISQNDMGNIFCMSFSFADAKIYNNTVYIGSHRSPSIIREKSNSYDYFFKNNIIYNESDSAQYIWGPGGSRFFSSNVLYNKGSKPLNEILTDAKVLTTDPKFINPGSGGFGINTVNGYKLQEGSPCINSGVSISGNGGRDYFGNPLYNGAPDRGFYEFPVIEAEGGDDRIVYITDGSHSSQVQFDGSKSRGTGGTLTSYEWLENENIIASGIQATATLVKGIHKIFLKVKNSSGNVATDSFTVSVVEKPCGIIASSADGTDVAANVADGDLNSRWASNGIGENIIFTFCQPLLLNNIKIAWFKGNERFYSFTIEIKETENSTFKEVYSGLSSGTTLSLENVLWDPTKVYALKIVNNGNSVNDWISFFEILFDTEELIITNADNTRNMPNEIQVYPNPSNGIYQLSGTGIKEYEVLDITGKSILKSSMPNNNVEINLSTFSSGIYIIRLTTNSDIINKKIIKN